MRKDILMSRFIKLFLLASITLFIFAVSQNFESESINFNNLFWLFLILTLSYLIFRIIGSFFVSKISSKRVRYSFRKITYFLFVLSIIVVAVNTWVEDLAVLITVYGLVAAAVALALQDVFKNIIGGLTIFFKKIYSVGDRVKIGEVMGDVVDVSLTYTSLLEIQSWVRGDQPTGRIVMIPNNKLLSNEVMNYSKDHSFIWDEIFVPLTYGSDWERAKELILSIVNEEISTYVDTAERDIKRLQDRYYLTSANIESGVYVELTDNWIALYVRYVTPVKERRITANKITQNILRIIRQEKGIRIASESLTITQDGE